MFLTERLPLPDRKTQPHICMLVHSCPLYNIPRSTHVQSKPKLMCTHLRKMKKQKQTNLSHITCEFLLLQLVEVLRVVAVGLQTWKPKVCYLNTCWCYIMRIAPPVGKNLVIVIANSVIVVWSNFTSYICRSNCKYSCNFFFSLCVYTLLCPTLYVYTVCFFHSSVFLAFHLRVQHSRIPSMFAILIMILRGLFFLEFSFFLTLYAATFVPPEMEIWAIKGQTCELLPQFSGPSIVNPCRRTSVTISSLSEQRSS